MRLRYLCICLLGSSSLLAQDSPLKPIPSKTQENAANAGVPLPVKKVVLYKNGVGYFEHKGQVRGNQEFGIQFTTAQLNDVFKSLTLVDSNGGSINAVRYNSVAPLEEQLEGLQNPLSEDVTSAAFSSAFAAGASRCAAAQPLRQEESLAWKRSTRRYRKVARRMSRSWPS